MNKKIFFIFLFAFLIRLIALNQSLWLDEAVTANVVKNLDFFEILTKFSPTDFHPPLYYLFMKLWTNIFGYGEVVLRFPSIIFSLLTGYFVYKIASLFHGFIAGMLATVFFLFNPLIVYYSQEARMYMMATFFLTTAIYFFLKLVIASEAKQSQKKGIATSHLAGLAMTMAFLTFYGSVFLIIPMLIYLIYKKKYSHFIVLFVIFIVSLLLIFPLFYQQFINSKIALANVANWSLVLGKANIKNLLLIPIKFSIGRISFEPKWLYWGIAGGWTAFILFQISNIKYQNHILKFKSLNIFYFLLTFPLVLGFIVSFWTPLLQYFRFLYLIPIMAILLAKKNTTVYRYTVVIGFTVFSFIYLLNLQFHREDWKSLVKALPKNMPVYMITSSSDSVKYYNKNILINELKDSRIKESEKEIIVIPYTADIYGFDYQKILLEKNYRLADKKTFRGLELEFFILNN